MAQPLWGQGPESSKNRPGRLEWFRDIGFGMFIHWSVDAPLGGVISHSLVGADADYTRRFFEQLPASFNPRKFHPDDWAELAGGHLQRHAHGERRQEISDSGRERQRP